MHQHTNQLIHESSVYLRQHAHNPVNWHPWSEEILSRAKQEDKPILVSIGYAACHWCHVMERESFEDEETASLMNEHFINIKIDREERPDLDHIYMDAVQAMTGSGGWPLNVFLTPEAKPFYGGTYFPPRPLYNRSSWKEILTAIAKAFTEKRSDINAQADQIMNHLHQSNNFGISSNAVQLPFQERFSKEKVDLIYDNLMKSADKEWGGFGRAPKFPQTFSIQFLFRHHHFTGNKDALNHAELSLNKMIEGGIYDQIGGGFARYSTDREWLAPHFEKMLYDNALLIETLSEAYQITGKKIYADTIRMSIEFLEREMLDGTGGFYSALDADSEGEEGKYYVWTKIEIQELLKEDADLFCQFFDVSENGNWEGKNILRVLKPLEEFAKANQMDPESLRSKLQNCGRKLLEERSKRIRPQLDDKIILGWNALINCACCKAYAALGDERFMELAIRNMKFIVSNLQNGDEGEYFHTFKEGTAKFPAFLDDYACLIRALIHLQEITGDQDYLERAKKILTFVNSHFQDEEQGDFFYTPSNQNDIILRKKEIYDGATPSGNSIMAWNLHYLSLVFDMRNWTELAEKITDSIGQVIIRYPTSFGNWAMVYMEIVLGTRELVIVGYRYKDFLKDILQHFIPHKILQSNPVDSEIFPLLKAKYQEGKTYAYLCKDYACSTPVEQANELLQLVEKELKR